MYIDMPITDLKKYQGINPKPMDFDEYWTRALLDLENLSMQYELIPASIQNNVADCYHLYFIGVGGARIHCKFVKPKSQSTPGPGLAMFHGYSMNSGDWFDKIAYAAQGFTVLALDCRGQGGLSEDIVPVKGPTLRGHIIRGIDDPNSANMYYRQVFLDTVQTVQILMSMDGVNEDRIGVMGWSQGGALATACAALEPKVKKAIAIYPFLSDYKRAWEMDINLSAYAEIADYFRMFDPLHERENEIFTKLGYIDIQHLAERIQASVHWVTGLTDEVCPPSTQFATFNKIVSEKELLLYHEYGHENLPNIVDVCLQRLLTL
ncbi:alpha/beta fold hydrolase [Bacillus sp. HMF5848]|nr:alpha/beta fold hydrolase [Bacillus sp. HMF5848]RSK28333.1 alpha/beta fold hydrolase [Bacillus sp. HMF5848]